MKTLSSIYNLFSRGKKTVGEAPLSRQQRRREMITASKKARSKRKQFAMQRKLPGGAAAVQ